MAIIARRSLPTAFLVLISRSALVQAQVDWTASDQNPVIEHGVPGAWDGGYIFANSIIKVGDEYRLYYAGTPGFDWPSGVTVGCASSMDLVYWTKCGEEGSWCNDNPVLPQSGSWDATRAGAAVVLRDDPGDPRPFKMWYVSADATGERIRSEAAASTRRRTS